MRFFVIVALGYVISILLFGLAIRIAERQLRSLW